LLVCIKFGKVDPIPSKCRKS